MSLKILRMAPMATAVVLAFAPLAAISAETPPPVLGETIRVVGSPADAAPTGCTVAAEVTCANLRSAIAYANGNDNGTAEAPKYDRIVLDNGSTHTLTLQGANEGAAASGDLDILSHVVIETAVTDPLNPAATKATIQGGEGFGDRLIDINTPPEGVPPAASVLVTLNNLVLTKGQAVFTQGGAIYANDGAVTTINRSVITDNFASWDGNFGDPLVDGDGTTESQGSGGGIYSKGALTISFSTLSRNYANTRVGVESYQKNGNGGAIYASQATTIVDSTIGGEGAGNFAINGGGIQMAGGNKLEILRSTFSHNDAVSGGAINVVSPSAQPFTITNSTFSANHVTDAGAGINTNSSVSILNSTIANNVKDSGNKGSGLNLVGGTATLKNALLANNLGGGVSANCGKVGSGALAVVSGGGNLSTDATCGLTLSSDQQNVADPMVGPLALNDNVLNGTFTHALLTGSPAIDKGITDGCPGTDQRGAVRPFDALVIGTRVCDIGAYELIIDRQDLSISSLIATPDRLLIGGTSTVSVIVSNSASTVATAAVLKTAVPSGLSFKSAVGATCTLAASEVTCALGDLAAKTLKQVNMVFSVASAGTNVLTSTVSATSEDPFPSNNTASVTIVGLTNVDLNLTAEGSTVLVGNTGRATFTVLNQSAGDAKNVVLSGSAPEGMTVVGVGDASLCTFTASAFSCTIPEILGGQSRAVTINVSSAAAGQYSVSASVTGDVIDADSADNSAVATVNVLATTDDGGGCTMSSGKASFDPTLLLLAALGLGGIALRRARRQG